MKSLMASTAAAPPPTALNNETSCGMDVIWIWRAVRRPIPPPNARPPMMMAQLPKPG